MKENVMSERKINIKRTQGSNLIFSSVREKVLNSAQRRNLIRESFVEGRSLICMSFIKSHNLICVNFVKGRSFICESFVQGGSLCCLECCTRQQPDFSSFCEFEVVSNKIFLPSFL